MNISSPKLLKGAAYLPGELILNARTRLERIVVSDEDFVPKNPPPMNLLDMVFQNIGIVVKVIGRKRLRDLFKPGSHLHTSESSNFMVSALFATFPTRARENADQQEQKAERKPRQEVKSTEIAFHLLIPM